MMRIRARSLAVTLAVGAVAMFGEPVDAAAQEGIVLPAATHEERPAAERPGAEPVPPIAARATFEPRPVPTPFLGGRILLGGSEPRVQRRRNLLRSALIGAGIGAGIGALPGLSHCHNEGGRNCPRVVFPYAGVGTLVGLGIGAAVGAF